MVVPEGAECESDGQLLNFLTVERHLTIITPKVLIQHSASALVGAVCIPNDPKFIAKLFT